MVHVSDPDTGDSMWDNAAFCMGCDHMLFGDGHVTVDLMAHEWGHAIDHNEGEMFNYGATGALEESFCDVSAVMLDTSNWTLGEGTPGRGTSRDIANPPAFGDPDHYLDFVITSDDNAGVHLGRC